MDITEKYWLAYSQIFANGQSLERGSQSRFDLVQRLARVEKFRLYEIFVNLRDLQADYAHYNAADSDTVVFWALFEDVNRVLFDGVCREDLDDYLCTMAEKLEAYNNGEIF